MSLHCRPPWDRSRDSRRRPGGCSSSWNRIEPRQSGGDRPYWNQGKSAGTRGEGLGWTYRVRIRNGPNVSYVGVATDTVDDIGAALAAALPTTASYLSPTLTAADGAADGLGDKVLKVTATPPGAANPYAAAVGTITHEGAASADLSVVLDVPTAIPVVMREL